MTAAEIERPDLKAMINLVEVSQLVVLLQLLEHRFVEECVELFSSNDTQKKTQMSKFTHNLSL